MSDRRWAIILHGGAGSIRKEHEPANRVGCRKALDVGTQILTHGGSALDAVESTIRILEKDPAFNAGYGSVLNADGQVEMDAALMDGATYDIGAVAAIQGVRHPISIARLLLREAPILLVSEGALRFAREHAAELCAPEEMIALDRQANPATQTTSDTVGCIALDSSSNIAVGLSTGGLCGKRPGRVGDSALPGCGFYADNAIGGVAFSGKGESIARLTLATQVTSKLVAQAPQAAIEEALAQLSKVGGDAGAIAIDKMGRIGWAHNSTMFAIAYATSELITGRVYLRKQEELQPYHYK